MKFYWILKTLYYGSIKFIKSELFSARIVSVFIGIFSIILSIKSTGFLESQLIIYSLNILKLKTSFINKT